MTLRINFKSGKPVHVQLVDQIKTAAASGALRHGEALSAIGPLAEQLRVSRNSVAKAYSELESMRVIESLPGQGYFLKEHHSPLRKDVWRKPLLAEIDQVIIQAPKAIQKTLVYSLLTGLLAALYLGLVGGIGTLFVQAGVIRGELVAVLSTVVVAAVFMPVRSRVQRFVDRLVFARRFEFARALQVINAEARSQPDLDSYIQRVVERVESALHGRLELIRDYAAMRSLVDSFPSLLSARAPVWAGADLLMPVFSDDELLGVLRHAGKPTGQEYQTEDWEFLTAVGEQVAIVANQSRSRKERQEAEYALDIQRGLLPRKIPQVPGFMIAGSWQPAKTVGGDYYDVFKLSDTELALVIADVAGKGIPAALLMASLQATVRAYATSDSRDVCGKVNRAISASNTLGKFITFFYAVLDSAGRRLTYTNAGHNPPLLARQDGSCLRLETGGAVLGVFADGAYEQAGIDLLPGDRLVLFTDGITEAAGSLEEEFGEERLIAVLRENPAAPAPALRDAIMRRVTQFCREDFADDATLLTVTDTGSPMAHASLVTREFGIPSVVGTSDATRRFCDG
jgi:serine phosphatase RsbU (regulator of sigma subunit)/DNA-binding transcriptional regulator YhcF (GntR family)